MVMFASAETPFFQRIAVVEVDDFPIIVTAGIIIRPCDFQDVSLLKVLGSVIPRGFDRKDAHVTGIPRILLHQ